MQWFRCSSRIGRAKHVHFFPATAGSAGCELNCPQSTPCPRLAPPCRGQASASKQSPPEKVAWPPHHRGLLLHHNPLAVRLYWVIALLSQGSIEVHRTQRLHWVTTAVFGMRDHQQRRDHLSRLYSILRSIGNALLDDLRLAHPPSFNYLTTPVNDDLTVATSAATAKNNNWLEQEPTLYHASA